MNRFRDKTYQQYYLELFDTLKLQVAQEKDDYIIGNPTEDLVKFYLLQGLQPIEFDDSEEEVMSHNKSIKTINSRERNMDISKTET